MSVRPSPRLLGGTGLRSDPSETERPRPPKGRRRRPKGRRAPRRRFDRGGAGPPDSVGGGQESNGMDFGGGGAGRSRSVRHPIIPQGVRDPCRRRATRRHRASPFRSSSRLGSAVEVAGADRRRSRVSSPSVREAAPCRAGLISAGFFAIGTVGAPGCSVLHSREGEEGIPVERSPRHEAGLTSGPAPRLRGFATNSRERSWRQSGRGVRRRRSRPGDPGGGGSLRRSRWFRRNRRSQRLPTMRTRPGASPRRREGARPGPGGQVRSSRRWRRS